MNWLQRLLGRDDIRLTTGELYMRRWLFPPRHLPSFFKKLPGLRVHNIVKSDSDRALHCHPFDFITIILKGGYYEHLADGTSTWHGAPAILFRQAETLHRLELDSYDRYADGGWKPVEKAAWTFVIRGPIRRAWGFLQGGQWVHWKLFTDTGSEGQQ